MISARQLTGLAIMSIGMLMCADLMISDAFANYPGTYSPLQCINGQPVPNTSLYDGTRDGACKFTGIQHIFSTIVCQFVTIINEVMGKLYCSIQSVFAPVAKAVVTLYVIVYGAQILMGTAQLNSTEFITRVLKMLLVLWMITDPTFGVSKAISMMFDFFIGFMTESSHWMIAVLSREAGMNIYTGYSYNPGITDTFKFLDEWAFTALTGGLSDGNGKVMGFFIGLSMVMPSVAGIVFYWWVTVVKMMLNTLISFLMAVVGIAFLLGISPIFLSMMLFRITFQYFDQWLRFMFSFAIQVMLSFAILTMWLFSMSMFGPFFDEMASVIFRYQSVVRPAAAVYNPASAWGVCPHTVYKQDGLHVVCDKQDFDPYNNAGDARDVIPPSRIPQMRNLILYIFYNLISLIIISAGFAALQKNAAQIAKQLAGPSFGTILNKSGIGMTNMGSVSKAGDDAKKMMSKDLFARFDRRHDNTAKAYESIVNGAQKLVTSR